MGVLTENFHSSKKCCFIFFSMPGIGLKEESFVPYLSEFQLERFKLGFNVATEGVGKIGTSWW